MPALPGTIALANIADGASIVAADHRNNYAAIQGAVNALIALFSNGVLDGDPLVWDGVNAKWVAASTLAAGRARAPRVVTSAMSGGPPASPVDQDIWIATAVDANGTRWSFQYNAGSGSALKWEFIGGSPAEVDVETRESTASGAYVDLATVGPSIVLARAGDYAAHWGATPDTDASSQNPGALVGLNVAGAIVSQAKMSIPTNAQFWEISVARSKRQLAIAAASTVKLQYSVSNSLTTNFGERFLSILPVRIS